MKKLIFILVMLFSVSLYAQPFTCIPPIEAGSEEARFCRELRAEKKRQRAEREEKQRQHETQERRHQENLQLQREALKQRQEEKVICTFRDNQMLCTHQ